MGQHDPSVRRRAVRKGRERGCWVYIPQESLAQAGRANSDPPFYRLWAGRKGNRVMVQLYESAES